MIWTMNSERSASIISSRNSYPIWFSNWPLTITLKAIRKLLLICLLFILRSVYSKALFQFLFYFLFVRFLRTLILFGSSSYGFLRSSFRIKREKTRTEQWVLFVKKKMNRLKWRHYLQLLNIDFDSDWNLYSSRKFYCFNVSTIVLPLFCVWFAMYCLLIDPHIQLCSTPKSVKTVRYTNWLITVFNMRVHWFDFFFALFFIWFEREKKIMQNAKSTTFDNNYLLMLFNESMRTKDDFKHFSLFSPRWKISCV